MFWRIDTVDRDWQRLPSEIRSSVLNSARRGESYGDTWIRDLAVRWARSINRQTRPSASIRTFLVVALPSTLGVFGIAMLLGRNPVPFIVISSAGVAVVQVVYVLIGRRDSRAILEANGVDDPENE
jgi:hypothetical protein